MRTIMLLLVLFCSLFTIGCHTSRESQEDILFSNVPMAGSGGPDSLALIQGRVLRAGAGQRIVLYAHSAGVWWLQPFTSKPFTEIKPDLTWQNTVHLGDQYAAIIVGAGYTPVAKLQTLPVKAGPVLAVATVSGTPPHTKQIRFSGYDWDAQEKFDVRGGKLNPYDPDNAWVDQAGLLHLKVDRRENQWFCAEVSLKQSLGPGLYQFTVRDVSRLDPAAVLTMYTWQTGGPFNREVDVEVSRWGNRDSKNAQFVVQPYYEPSNISRFEAPPGLTTFSFRWEPGRLLFNAKAGRAQSGNRAFATHTFVSGVPEPSGEVIRISLYAYGHARTPMKDQSELIIENFTYSP